MPSANNDLVQSGVEFVMGARPSQTGSVGVRNPYGIGASAYEPKTVIYDPSNDPLMKGSELQVSGVDALDKKKADEAAAQATATPAATPAPAGANAGDAGTPPASGSALRLVNAAKQLLGKPYVWGGTTINGTDCSGLLYYAFNKAGIKMPRYRASDYAKVGKQVSADQALPGDVVYWDEAGAVDHVGIYLGNGLVLNSPHSGTVTQIDRVWGHPQYRRIIQDNGFQHIAQPTGSPILAYNGQAAVDVFTAATPRAVPTSDGMTSNPLDLVLLPTNGYKVRAI